jgi:Flp pilus assembly protein TadG
MKRRAMRLCVSFLRARKASAAIEFAFVAPIFFLFLMATIETGIIFLGGFVLQNATNNAARQIRTGQVALGGVSQSQFRQMICDGTAPLLDCDSNLQIDVETFASFASANITNPVVNGKLNPALSNWQTGSVCSIVLVRAFYTYNVATPLLTPFLVNINSTQHLLSAAVAFRTEPYSTAVAGC